MNSRLNWDHVRFFIEVTKAGSVIKAALNLGVSHATVLRNISRLEQDLGTTLFDRRQTGYRITARGEELLSSALAMQDQAYALQNRAAAKNPAPEGLLRLIVPDDSLFDLMPLLAAFHVSYPLIRVHTDRQRVDAMDTGKSDAAILVTNAPPEKLVGRQVTKLEFAYYASANYLDQHKHEPLRASECDWITWGSADSSDMALSAEQQEKSLRRFAKQPRIVMRTTDHSETLAATNAGLGIGLLKKPQSDLVEVPLKPDLPSIGVWILTHQDLQRAGRIHAFMEFAVTRFMAPSLHS